jgi:sodium/potassium-transporting ATPase subunit alpha
LIFDNLKKSIAYTLEHLLPEVIPYLAFFALRIPLPLTTVLILCIDLGTDLFPAIACAYEEKESDIMKRKPRNAKTDRLVGWKLFVFSYLQIGAFQVLGTFFSYYIAWYSFGFRPGDVLGTADWWDSDDTRYAIDINGVPRDISYRKEALKAAQTSVFLSIVIVQWGGLLVCKTRKLSLFQQGMRNTAINISLVAETLIAIIIIYCPGVQDVLGAYPISGILWLPAMPFALIIIIYDEARKWLIRNKSHDSWWAWVERYTYY